MPSTTSFRSSGVKYLEPVAPLHVEPRSASRASSRHTDNRETGPTRPRSSASRPSSAMGATLYANNKSADVAQSSRSRTSRHETQTYPRPESVRSSASKNQPSPLNFNTSQTNLVAGQQQRSRRPSSSTLNLASPVRRSTSRVSLREAESFANGFDDGPIAGDGHRSQTPLKQPPPPSNSSALNLVPPVHRSTSRVSLREAGSFSNGFDDSAYLDPAFFPGDRPNGHSALDMPSRPVSRGTSSILSYV